MNILPKKYSQFKSKQYWNTFFSQLKKTNQQFFQWYGNYSDYQLQLNKIFKHLIYKNQNKQSLGIFHIGCGKSIFGQDIFMNYPKFKIMNTDYSDEIIGDMIKRVLEMKFFLANSQEAYCKYQICDMLNEKIQDRYMNNFNIVLDKGTLDAILPQDEKEQIDKIKKTFFKNVSSAMNKEQTSCYIIISMLQPFVLRTILQYFYQENIQQFQVHIQQSRIKDSKMQPFLIFIKRLANKQLEKLTENEKVNKKVITIKLLNGKEISLKSIQQIMTKIQQLQQTVLSSQKVKSLFPKQQLTYSISNPNNLQKPRYSIQIIDHSLYQKLKQNTCSVFIVPQGKQNSHLFSTKRGLSKLIKQINTSRLIVVKLIIGNVFKNIEQVKTQVNGFVSNFIQEKCSINQVQILTDAEDLGIRKYIYENQAVYVEQIPSNQNKQQEAFRRVILKNNLQLVQSQFKLIYKNSDNVSMEVKELQKKTKILNAKKGKVIAIDRNYIDLGYCQYVITGLNKLLFSRLNYLNNQSKINNHQNQNLNSPDKNNNSKSNKQILILGGGGYAIPKFIYEHFNNSNNISLTTVQIQKTLCSEQVFGIFEIQSYVKKPTFKIINQDAHKFIITRNQQNKNKNLQQIRYSSIIIDISSQNSCSQEQGCLPPKQFLSPQFISKCSQLLQQHGVIVYNIIRKGFYQKQLIESILEWNWKFKVFGGIYVAGLDEEDGEQEDQGNDDKVEQDSLVLFMVKLSDNERINQHIKIKQWMIDLNNNNSKNKDNKFEFEQQCLNNIKMIYPLNKLVNVNINDNKIKNKKYNKLVKYLKQIQNKYKIQIIKEQNKIQNKKKKNK